MRLFGLTFGKTIEDRVKRSIANEIGAGVAAINNYENLRDDLTMDELDMVDLWLVLEDEFDIKIDHDEFDGQNTVQDVINLVEKLVSEK